MLREEGRVIALEGNYAVVASGRKSACGGCHAQASCGALSGGLGNRQKQFRAVNRASAQVGERVILEISERLFLRASFIAYVLPLVALFSVGALAKWGLLAAGFTPFATEGLSALAGLAALGASFSLLRGYNARMEGSDQYTPVIRQVIDPDAECHLEGH